MLCLGFEPRATGGVGWKLQSHPLSYGSRSPALVIYITTVCPFHVKTNLFNGFELDKFKWLNLSNTPDFVADEILDGILRNKHLIGCPKFEFFLMAAVKK